MKLSDGRFAWGQVLDKQYTAPTCCLFGLLSKHAHLDAASVTTNQVLTILHLGSNCLDKGTWRVVGNAQLCAAPDSGPGGKLGEVGSISFGGGGTLSDLAEAYYGLVPWNVYNDEKYFDRLLMPGVQRPPIASGVILK